MTKAILAILSMTSLILCLMSSILHFLGKVSMGQYKGIFMFASISWFIFATIWASNRRKN